MASAASIPDRVNRADEARAAVSQTALFTAALRVFESNKNPDDRLFHDPWAKVLVGSEERWASFSEEWSIHGRDFWVDFLAVRTRWIDDAINAQVTTAPELQMVLLGAGLDTRAYRLDSLKAKQVFEVDFAEVLQAKQAILSEGNAPAAPLAKRVAVAADFSDSDGWRAALVAAGFDTLRPSLWVMEGLSGYLSEEELDRLFKDIAKLAVDGSRTIQTYLGAQMRDDASTKMHYFFVQGKEHVSEFVENYGWRVNSVQSIKSVADVYRRGGNMPAEYQYYLLDAAWDPSLAQPRL